jgi:integrase
MSIHKATVSGRPRWQVRWREGGTNRQRSFDRADDAHDFESEIRRERQVRGVDRPLGEDTSVAEFVEEWWATTAPQLAPRTQEQYAVALNLRILPELGGYGLREIKPSTVEDWLGRLDKRGDGRMSIVRAASLLGTITERAAASGLIDGNPVRVARKPRTKPTRQPAPITLEQVEAIRSRLNERDAVIVSVLAYSGLRAESEALTLTWWQVGERTISVRATKTGHERHVRLVEPLKDDLRTWREHSGGGSLVFPHDGGAWTRYAWRTWRRRVWRPAAMAVGLPADSRPLDLRASFASLLICEGRNVVEVAQQLDHSSMMCLNTYARAFAEAPDPEHRITAEQAVAAARAVSDVRLWFAP